jgi:hypothetical protein
MLNTNESVRRRMIIGGEITEFEFIEKMDADHCKIWAIDWTTLSAVIIKLRPHPILLPARF